MCRSQRAGTPCFRCVCRTTVVHSQVSKHSAQGLAHSGIPSLAESLIRSCRQTRREPRQTQKQSFPLGCGGRRPSTTPPRERAVSSCIPCSLTQSFPKRSHHGAARATTRTLQRSLRQRRGLVRGESMDVGQCEGRSPHAGPEGVQQRNTRGAAVARYVGPGVGAARWPRSPLPRAAGRFARRRGLELAPRLRRGAAVPGGHGRRRLRSSARRAPADDPSSAQRARARARPSWQRAQSAQSPWPARATRAP